jgi:hypothetical protein
VSKFVVLVAFVQFVIKDIFVFSVAGIFEVSMTGMLLDSPSEQSVSLESDTVATEGHLPQSNSCIVSMR